MQIFDLQLDDAAAVEQAAQALVAGFRDHINTTPKYVVSTTLDNVEWGTWANVNLIKGNLAEAITRLKQQPGKNIGVAGSPTLVRSLLLADLLDELTLMIHPVVAGSGKRLFEGESTLKRLKLVASTTCSATIFAYPTPTRCAGTSKANQVMRRV
jgi:dihydrofolate reductase